MPTETDKPIGPAQAVERHAGDCDICGTWDSDLQEGVGACCRERQAAASWNQSEEPPGVPEFPIESASGCVVDLADPDPATIRIKDIAHHLARLNRFTGATSGGYGVNVAQHSVWVSDYLLEMTAQESGTPDPLLALHGLLHDAAEAYLGDVSRPLKTLLADVYKPLEAQMLAAIYEALDLGLPSLHMRRLIKVADAQALLAEAERRMPSKGIGPHWLGVPNYHDFTAHRVCSRNNPALVIEPTMAEAAFLTRYRSLRKEAFAPEGVPA